MNASKEFNKIRADFMRRANHPEFPSSVLRLAYIIAYQEMDVRTETASITQKKLAESFRAGSITDRTIRNLLRILEGCGLKVEVATGPGKKSTYRILANPEKRKSVSAIYRKPVSGIEPKTGNLFPENRKINDTNTGNSFPPHLIVQESIQESKTKGSKRALAPPGLLRLEDTRAARAQPTPQAEPVEPKEAGRGVVPAEPQLEISAAEIAEAFEEFFRVYPRKVNRDDAEAAFTKAIEAGADPEVIIERTKWFAVQRASEVKGGDGPQWTPYPATYLKKRSWMNAPPGAPILDESGAVVGYEAPQHTRSRREETSAEFAARYLREEAEQAERVANGEEDECDDGGASKVMQIVEAIYGQRH